MIHNLYIFDFDGTLFNSPQPPDWWKDKSGWWNEIQSMTPPCLPKEPSAEWWVESTVKAVREALKDEYNYVVLLTGRRDGTFNSRIHELLKQKDLNFDEVHLSDQSDTQAFKVAQIDRILEEHPAIETVDLWEDFVSMVLPYRATVKEEGAKFRLHKVKVEPRKAECTEDEFLTKKVALRYASLV